MSPEPSNPSNPSFFRPVEPRPFDDDDYAPPDMPAWMGPPWGVAPATVLLAREIGRSSGTVIALESARVFREGFALRLSIRVNERGRMARQRLWGYLDRAHGRGALDERFDPTGLRWGVRFGGDSRGDSGGDRGGDSGHARTITTQDESPWAIADGDITDVVVPGPVLEGLGRPSGFMDEWVRDFWVWPHPPAPTFDVGVEWTARGIAETVTTIDATELIAATARVRDLWT